MVLKQKKDGKIEKLEDKQWQDWFSKIDEKTHGEFLQKLGLDNEDIKEWHGSHGKLDVLLDCGSGEELPKKPAKNRQG